MRWVKLGIVPERSRPASPRDNGGYKRMHGTLKRATLQPPERNARRQQDAFDRFQQEYNHERPHGALDDATPASCYSASPRQMPRRVPELDYGDQVVVRRISQQGSPKMNGGRTFVSETFAHEWMGLRALDERYFEVLFGPMTVGFLDTFQHFSTLPSRDGSESLLSIGCYECRVTRSGSEWFLPETDRADRDAPNAPRPAPSPADNP